MDDLKDLIGRRLRAYREQKHLSQAKLAELSGVHHTYIGQIERGERNVTIDTVWRISRALGVSIPELFECLDITKNGTRSTASKCYDLVLEQSQSDQERLLRVMEEISGYGK